MCVQPVGGCRAGCEWIALQYLTPGSGPARLAASGHGMAASPSSVTERQNAVTPNMWRLMCPCRHNCLPTLQLPADAPGRLLRELREALEPGGLRVFGGLPHDGVLQGVRLDAVAAGLGTRFVAGQRDLLDASAAEVRHPTSGYDLHLSPRWRHISKWDLLDASGVEVALRCRWKPGRNPSFVYHSTATAASS